MFATVPVIGLPKSDAMIAATFATSARVGKVMIRLRIAVWTGLTKAAEDRRPSYPPYSSWRRHHSYGGV
jgi:hypothetical protein